MRKAVNKLVDLIVSELASKGDEDISFDVGPRGDIVNNDKNHKVSFYIDLLVDLKSKANDLSLSKCFMLVIPISVTDKICEPPSNLCYMDIDKHKVVYLYASNKRICPSDAREEHRLTIDIDKLGNSYFRSWREIEEYDVIEVNNDLVLQVY